MALKLFSANKWGADTNLPGFDLSARKLLRFPSGDFVFAGGSYRTEQITLPNGQAIAQTQSGLGYRHEDFPTPCLSGIACRNECRLGPKVLTRRTWTRLTEGRTSAWLSTPEYAREFKLGTAIKPLAFHRRKLLNNHAFALDFNPTAAARLLREPQGLSFDQLKNISWLDEFSNFNIRSNNKEIC